jgi:hypothetical protein
MADWTGSTGLHTISLRVFTSIKGFADQNIKMKPNPNPKSSAIVGSVAF